MIRSGSGGFAAFAAALFLALGIVVTYVNGAVLDSGNFTNHALDALDDEGVRTEVSSEIASSLVPGGAAGASGDSAISDASDRLFDEPAFRTIVRSGVGELHRGVFNRDSDQVGIELGGVGAPVREALMRTDPDLAAQVPPDGDVRIFNGTAPSWLLSGARAADSVRFLGIGLLAIAALLAVVALAISRRRLATAGVFGGSLAVIAAILIALLLIAKARLTGLIDDPGLEDAAAGAWSAFFGGLQTQLIVLAIAGAAIPIATRLVRVR